MNRQIAHNIENKSRTEDVQIVENVDFTAMLLSDAVLQGLLANGFKKPSPIQLKAIPMGRCGYDLILQAKSGTGKTAVFGIIALEMIDVTKNEIQVLILAPTREIAVQIKEVLQCIGMNFEGLKVEYFIGGTNVNEDLGKLKNCHIAVGAPGRIKHLVKDGHMNIDSVKLFVLDEADKVIGTEQQKDINFIYSQLSNTKQMIASSATYPGNLIKFLSKYMLTPTVIDSQNDVPTLLGIRQFVTTVPHHLNVVQQMDLKTRELIRILQNVSFTQCIVFCNYQTRAETLCNNLSRQNWPTTYISAAQNQKSRLEAVNSLKEFKCRILSTTDLTARGIDAANVDLVINYEVPVDSETYLHRMGRAGRYGSSGLCISIASEGAEVEKLQKLLGKISSKLSVMKFPKENVPQDIWTCDIKQFDNLCAKVDSKTDQICDTLKELSVNNEEARVETIKKEKGITNIVKNVETFLELLNEDDEILKESAKKQLNNIKPAAIFEILTKGETLNIKQEITDNIVIDETINIKQEISDDISDENITQINVEEMLYNLRKQEESSKNDLKNKFCNMYPSSVLNLLTHDKLDNSTTSEESDSLLKKSKCKKAKRDKNKKSNTEDTENNEKFENEAKLFQENSTVHKNTALYNLTKVIVKEEPITEDSVTSTEELLKIMEQEDNIELRQQKSKLKFDDLLNKLGMLTDNAPVIGNWEIINTEFQDKDINCTCPENLFTKIYDVAISNSETHWLDPICEIHKTLESDNKSGEDYSEEYDDENEEYFEEYYEEDNLESEENMEDVYVYEEDVLVKAYDYALKTKEHEIEISPETNLEDSYGYAASYTYDHLQTTKRKRKRNKKNKNRTCPAEEEANNLLTDSDTTYESYFEYYNTMLKQNAPYFTDVSEFERWFTQWQQSVYGVRNYVQEEIYKQEILARKSQ